VIEPGPKIEKELVAGEAITLYSLSVATALACLLFPLISKYMIVPYLSPVFGPSVSPLGEGNTIIMVIMMAMVILFPVSFLGYGRGVKVVPAYLGGANVESNVRFRSTAASVQNVTLGNYYLHNIFNEDKLSLWGVIGGTVLLVIMLALALAL
jgi:ech hydrogenase subunit A